ncbi:MAG: LamG domain-containing protein, partial [Planctomycetota bacterium]
MSINVGGEPVEYTDKSQEAGYEDWIAWVRWGADLETHDATNYQDIGGTPLNVGMGAGNGSAGYGGGSVLNYTKASENHDPICNTWLEAGEDDPNCNLVLYADGGLTPGEYWVWGYHNIPGSNEPNMPRVYVQTYSGFFDPNNILMQNVGAPNDPDGGGVIQIHDVNTIDVNVPIQDEAFDANLIISFVKFYTDDSPVKITYEGDPNTDTSAVLNAFIIFIPTPRTAYHPFPEREEEYACPSTDLIWTPGGFTQDVNSHKLYFGTDLTEELLIFGDNLEKGDANWVAVNWNLYDSNVLGDGNSDGNSHSSYHSFTPNSVPGTLTSVDINASEAGSMRVSLYIKKTLGIEDGDVNLYYYDGTNWDFVVDLNSIGPNDVWLHYTEDITDSNYLISNFKIRISSDISAGEVFVDDVSVTNTWLLGSKWFVDTLDANTYDIPYTLDFNGTYYWRVDDFNDACDASPWQGRTWSFTTEKGFARKPVPRDNAPFIPLAGTTLSWEPSCFADYHDVYLGTDFDDVNDANDPNSGPGQGRHTDPNYDTGALVFDRKYYWRVDEIGQAGLFKGDVWSFQTIGYPLMHYSFDGVLDANLPDPITDDTGNVTFDVVGNGELKYDQPNPTYNPAGTSAHFMPTGTGGYGGAARPLIRSCFGPDLLDLDGLEYTIEAWIRQDGPANNIQDDDLEGTILRKDRETYGLGIDDDGTVKFMHRGQFISTGTAQVRIAEGTWHHIAAVFDACNTSNQMEKLYINGILTVDNNDPCCNPQDDYASDVVGIGAYQWQSETAKHLVNHFNGAIDELRVMDRALTIDEFLIRGDPNLAWLPRPFNYAIDVEVTADLEWEPGDYATSHEVYFGTSWYDVNDANNDANYWPDVYKGKQDPCSYELGTLDFAVTYYWRIDEVNDITYDRWKGSIWRFTIADFITIDDFDDDTAQDPPKFDWFNGNVLGTGASITLRTTEPVIGEHSM